MSIKHWTNDFTKECNKFLTNGHEESLDYCCGTYLWGNEDGIEYLTCPFCEADYDVNTNKEFCSRCGAILEGDGE